ncbi:MAG: RNA polymerase sigma factor [Candidatus Aminicenantes bacterium]|nr:MAG: RNA polymerase sigma factor [Candidatus Aminicenantes bacterium]
MMKHEPQMNTNDKMLILLAKQGNESAFRELYETNYEMIYRLAYRYVKSTPDAEDILQETFIKAFKAIQKFDFNISTNFSAWIYQICVRCSYDYHRKRKRRKSDQTTSLSDTYAEPEAQNSSPERLAISNQAIQQVRNALSVLSPKQRIIFDLRHLQHEALKEIAERLQVSPSTVKKQLERAVAKLRIQLEPLWREK